MEYVDIVDEDDHVTGRETREKAKKKELIRRSVHVLVLNKKGDVLIQKRSMKCNLYPGMFDASVGGHVRSGETYEEAAKREMKEEIGVSAKLKKIGKYKSYSERQRVIRTLYIAKHNGPFNIDKNEVEAVKFMPRELIRGFLDKNVFTNGFVKSFEILEKNNF